MLRMLGRLKPRSRPWIARPRCWAEITTRRHVYSGGCREQHDPDPDRPTQNCFPRVLRLLIQAGSLARFFEAGDENAFRVGRWLSNITQSGYEIGHWRSCNTGVSRPRGLRLHSPPGVSLLAVFAFPLALAFWVFVGHHWHLFPGSARPRTRNSCA